MTSSEIPTDPEPPVEAAPETATDAAPLPAARARGARLQIAPWMLAAAVVPPGWYFVLHTARWHFTPSTVMLMLGWLAIVLTGFFAIRMAMTAAASGDEGWFAARGRLDELEREKRSLLKAIKEVEFDLVTGKLTPEDAAAFTATYRARAIEVIKAIEAEAGTEAGVREQILAEVRARQELAKVKGKAAKAKAKKEKAA